MIKRSRCAECDALCEPAEYHPFLYCELYKLGHHEPGRYLRKSGFVRSLELETQRQRADAAEKDRDAAYASLHALRESEPA